MKKITKNLKKHAAMFLILTIIGAYSSRSHSFIVWDIVCGYCTGLFFKPIVWTSKFLTNLAYKASGFAKNTVIPWIYKELRFTGNYGITVKSISNFIRKWIMPVISKTVYFISKYCFVIIYGYMAVSIILSPTLILFYAVCLCKGVTKISCRRKGNDEMERAYTYEMLSE